jgi:hypothetical protein
MSHSNIDGDTLIEAIRLNSEASDDVLYCHPKHRLAILDTISSTFGSGRTDNLKLDGKEIVTGEKFVRPIACQKGQVFPIAKDFK